MRTVLFFRTSEFFQLLIRSISVFYLRTVSWFAAAAAATKLVSYGADEIDEADDDEDSGESLPSVFNIQNFQAVSCNLVFTVDSLFS